MLEKDKIYKSQAFQGKRKYLTIYGLEGFQTSKSRIHLSSTVVIKPTSEAFHADFWTRAKEMGTRKSLSTLKENKFFIHHHYEASPHGNTFLEYDFAERFRQLLRCFQEGAVDIQFFQKHVYLYKKKPDPLGFSSNASNYWQGHNAYKIDEQNIKFFKQFATKFLSYEFEKARAVDVALRRLDYSYDRREAEDQIIDLIIGFEALFSDSSGEITYKLALRTANFLSANYEGKFVFDFMKKAYALRSSIVHGGKAQQMKWDDENVTHREVVTLLQRFLRLALQKIILNKDSLEPKNLIPFIDNMII